MHRFYLANFQQGALGAEEAHHARQVLRLKAGDTVNLFDGQGHEAQASITEITNQSVRLKILTETRTTPLPCRVTLAQAVPKKNMDLIVQKATELGVSRIVPLLSERTVVRLDEDAKKLDRWREIAMEACKQCGNNWLPAIEAPRRPPEFLADPGKFDLKLIASLQPGSRPLKQILKESAKPPGAVLILIGPEGDFTSAEISLARSSGCLPLSLGPLVLRADTAAIYTLSILHHELVY